jgi:hypothetical protein
MGRFFGIVFACAVLGEVPEFVSHPVAQPVFALIAVAVDEGGAAGPFRSLRGFERNEDGGRVDSTWSEGC